MATVTAHGSTLETNGNGHVSFSELVRAHHEWDASGGPAAAEDVARRYRELLAGFESESGEIIDAYWCRQVPSAVALTRRERELRSRLRRQRRKLEYRLHRVSDWVTDGTHEIENLLHDCDILAIKAANGLESVPRAVVMQWLLLVESHLLGFIERAGDKRPDPEQTKRFAAAERAELERIEDYYFRAGEKRAKMRYAEGMIGLGIVFLFLNALITAGVLAVFGALDLESAAVREFYASAAAGGAGAVISALMRMSGRGGFVIDHEMTRLEVTLVGAYRPLIGSVSGIIVYFLLKTPLLPLEESALTLPLFVVVAFLAGFSERWTRMVLSGAMRTIGQREPEPAEVSPPESAPAEPARTAPT
jgi:hypothetical protein